MTTAKSENDFHSWSLYASSHDDLFSIQRNIDDIFAKYSFYPEIDWGKYGYRPPEDYQVLGAWRHPQSKVFAFLLDNPHMITFASNIQVILYVVGEKQELLEIEKTLNNLKAKFNLRVEKEKTMAIDSKRIHHFQEIKSFKMLATSLALLTTILNLFSFYLRQLPSPNFSGWCQVSILQIFLKETTRIEATF